MSAGTPASERAGGTGAAAATRAAYSRRAAEYIAALGDIAAMSPIDRAAIAEWASPLAGPVLDAGCGPGHWTAYLHGIGTQVVGLDMVPEFIASARERFPRVSFRDGTLDSLPYAQGALAGILAWYSLIHTPPARVPEVLAEFARCLESGGSLLVGCFAGPQVRAFDHAVTTAYLWPPPQLSRALEGAGFRVVGVETRTDVGSRPHAAISATLG